MSKIRTAVVGLRMGAGHARAYHAAEGSELRWVCDLDEERAAEIAEELGCKYTTDWESILDDVDAVSICTPHHLHAPQSLRALAAGKHVLVEKPMANSEADCRAMIEAAERGGLKLMVAYPLRHLPSYRRVKEAIENNEFGTVISLNGFVHANLTPRPGSWFASKEQLGGGVLFSHGAHDIDIMVWLMGVPNQVACVTTRNGTEWMEGEGTAQCVMKFENGALGNLSVSWGIPYKKQPHRLQIHTTEAMLAPAGDGMEVIDKDGQRILTSESAEEKGKNTVLYEVEHFLSCIENDTQPETDGHDALKALRVIWEMYQLEEEGRLSRAM